MRFTVLRSKAVQVTDEHQFLLENYMPTTRQWDFQTQVHCFPDFLNAQIIDVFNGKASPLGLTAYPFLISQATNKWCSFDMYTYNTVEPRLTATFCGRTANGHTFSCKKKTLVNMVTRLIIRSNFFSPLVTVLTGCTRPF